MDTAYNQFAGLVNGFSFEVPNFVNCLALEANGAVLIGGSFQHLGGHPNTNNFTASASFTRQQRATRYNVARLIGGATPGPGTAVFAAPEYSIDENAYTLSVTLQRIDGRLGTLETTVITANGSAVNGSDFFSFSNQVAWPEFAYIGPKSVGSSAEIFARVPIFDDQLIEDDETFAVSLSAPFGSLNLGGELIPLGANVARGQSIAVIRDDDQPPAVIGFSSPSFFVSETGKVAVIKLVRSGNTNSTVSVAFEVRDGTALAGLDYAATNGLVTFRPNETNKSILLQVLDDQVADGNKTAQLVLTNVSSRNSLGLSTATLTIADDESVPTLTQPHTMANGAFKMQVAAPANASVIVQASSDLLHWTNVSSFISSNGIQIFLDPTAIAAPQRFYRAILAE